MPEITIEEACLKASDAVTGLGATPFLIYSEVFELPRRPLVFLSLPLEDFQLIGSVGNTIRGMFLTHMSASTLSESSIVNPSVGMTATVKTISNWHVSVTDPIYSATNLSDILLEDFPNVEWVRLHLRNMGLAIMEYLDASVADLYESTAGTNFGCAHMSYANIVTALAVMENTAWVVDVANPPFLVVSPDSAALMLQDSQFLDSKRYTLYELGRMMEGEIGQYAGCRVLKSPLLSGVNVTGGNPSDITQGIDHYAYIVFPNDTGRGPVTLMCWKRRLETRNFYWTQWAYTYYVSSVRAKPVLVQSTGVCKITLSATP